MPAIPIALSNPPIVVGIKQTKRATRTGMVKSTRRGYPKGFQRHHSDQKDECQRREQDGQSDLVWSLLARCTFDQGDHAIQKGLTWVRGNLNLYGMSDRTFVPPVTALRSPPDSRITGAD